MLLLFFTNLSKKQSIIVRNFHFKNIRSYLQLGYLNLFSWKKFLEQSVFKYYKLFDYDLEFYSIRNYQLRGYLQVVLTIQTQSLSTDLKCGLMIDHTELNFASLITKLKVSLDSGVNNVMKCISVWSMNVRRKIYELHLLRFNFKRIWKLVTFLLCQKNYSAVLNSGNQQEPLSEALL